MSPELPDPASVRTLLLDVGGVLVRPSFTRVAEALRAHGVEASAAALAAAENPVKRQLDRPPTAALASDEERGWEYFDAILQRVGVTPSAATRQALLQVKAWHDRHNAWDEVLPGVREALACFRERGLAMAVVSNANGTVAALLQRLSLAAYFQAVVDSTVVGVEKPDPRIFEIALRRLGAAAATAVHVGDMYEIDVVGARRAGVRPVLLDAEGLYPEADCPRVPSLTDLCAHLLHSPPAR